MEGVIIILALLVALLFALVLALTVLGIKNQNSTTYFVSFQWSLEGECGFVNTIVDIGKALRTAEDLDALCKNILRQPQFDGCDNNIKITVLFYREIQ